MQRVPLKHLIFTTLYVGNSIMQNAFAQSEQPPSENFLVEMSDILGRSHAIRTICNDRSDQYWRDYMSRLIDMEASNNPLLQNRLIEAFNDGYYAIEEQFTTCSIDARNELKDLVSSGQALAERMNYHSSNAE